MNLRLFFILIALSTCYARGQQFSYRHYSTEEGLPTSQVYQSIQDDEGFMWFGTDRGVVRFDGYEFEVYTTADGLPNNVVFHLFKDNLGRIWFATFSGELCYYENGQIKPYQFNHIIEEKLGHPLIVSFCVDSLGGVHLGLKQIGHCQIDIEGNYLQTDELIRHYSIKEVEDDFVFYKYNYLEGPSPSDDSTKLFYTNESGETVKLSIPFLRDVYAQGFIRHVERLDGSILFSLDNGLYELKNNEITARYEAVSGISDVIYIDNKIWVSCYSSGFTILDNQTFQNSQVIHLDKHTISSFYKDSEGAVWITTLNNGIYYLADYHHYSFSKNSGLVVGDVFSMASSGDKLLISNLEGKLCWMDMEKDSTYLIEGLDANKRSPPNVFYATNLESFFFRFNRDLCQINGDGQITTHTGCGFFTTYQDSIFAVNYEVTNRNTDTEGLPIRTYNIGFNMMQFGLRIFFVNHSYKIVGGIGGIQEIIPRPNEEIDSIFFWNQLDPIYNTRVVQFAAYDGFDFIAATRGKGILFVRDKKPYTLKKENGLLSDQLTCLFVDSSQTIWAGTSEGLSVISKDGNILNLRIEDGLVSNEITAIYVNQEKVYVGTKKGMTILNRSSIFKRKHKIPVVFKSVRLQGGEKLVSNNSVMDISYKEPFLEIEFSGMSYSSRGRIRYKYRLNTDENWQYTTINRLSFNDLAPGSYNLEILASNGENDWGQPGRLNIRVSYPFWQTTGFRVLITLLVLILFYLAYKLAVKRVKRREKIERQIQNLRFEALSAQMNPHFIFNSLNSIQNFIMTNEKKSSIQYLSKFAKLMRKTLDHSRNKNITLKQELEALVLYLDLEILRFGNEIDYDMEIDPNIDAQKVILPALLIQPIVENAILHGLRPKEDKGHIDLRFLKVKNQLVIIVEDDGVGRNIFDTTSTNKAHQSQGGYLTEERVMLFSEGYEGDHGYVIADLMIGDKSVGTRVIVKIPYILT